MSDLSEGDRRRLAQTIDRAADIYDAVRPDYPDELFDDLVRATSVVPGDSPSGSWLRDGQGDPLPMVHRGFRITCIEPGAHLATIACRKLSGSAAEVAEGHVEDWRPRAGDGFELVYAATAWKWADPARPLPQGVRGSMSTRSPRVLGCHARLPRAWRSLLRRDPKVYDEIGEGPPPGAAWPRPGELPDRRAEVEESGLFDIVHVRQFDWERVYTPGEYIGLLNTILRPHRDGAMEA